MQGSEAGARPGFSWAVGRAGVRHRWASQVLPGQPSPHQAL